MIEADVHKQMALKHMQKDLELSLTTSDLSLPLTAAANEVLKHAMLRGYGDDDVSAVFHVVWD